MPLWGLVPDSPWITAALKGRNAISRSGGRGVSGVISTNVKITFTKVVIYKPILNFELNHPSGMVGQHMRNLGLKIQAAAKKQVGVKTGALRQSINMEHKTLGGRQYIKVGSNMSYALMHHEGTRPHMIAAHPPGMLKFRGRGGAMVYRTAVMHPGTKANRYLSSQLRKFVR